VIILLCVVATILLWKWGAPRFWFSSPPSSQPETSRVIDENSNPSVRHEGKMEEKKIEKVEETQLQSVQSGGELVSPPISLELVAPKPQTEPQTEPQPEEQPEEQPELEDEEIPYEEVPFEEELEPVQHYPGRIPDKGFD
ncbi:MAG: hypothetical protein OEM02_14070, partial [Desulfobulbaceae bacterium]|nr:hypothetical protein [Desulfobulbaceae bacterium]